MANNEIENKRKAKEIAQSVSFFWTNEDDAEKSIIDTISLRKAIFNASLQAMEWKDEQHEQERQQWIDEACERLEDYFAPDGSMVPENIRLCRDLQQVIKENKTMDYKEKLELAKDWYNDQSTTKKEKVLLENLYPEIVESEDEKIMKEIIKHLRLEIETELTLSEDEGKRWIAWLEKQREREWNTDEKEKITNLKTFIAKCKGFNKENIQKAFDMIDSLKPQPHFFPILKEL